MDAASTLHHSLLPIFVLPPPLSARCVRGLLCCSNQAFAFTPPLVPSRMLLFSFIHILIFLTVSTAVQSPPQISPALPTHRPPTPAAFICIPPALHPLSLFKSLPSCAPPSILYLIFSPALFAPPCSLSLLSNSCSLLSLFLLPSVLVFPRFSSLHRFVIKCDKAGYPRKGLL